MGILEIIKEGDRQTKMRQKTFRLRENIALMLDSLSETTGLPQNEIVNSLLEEYTEEYNFLNKIKITIEEIRNGAEKKLIAYQHLYLGQDHSILTLLIIKIEEEQLVCKYAIYSGESFIPDYFEDGVKLFEDVIYFNSYDELIKLTAVNKNYSIEVFDLTDELEFTHLGIAKK